VERDRDVWEDRLMKREKVMGGERQREAVRGYREGRERWTEKQRERYGGKGRERKGDTERPLCSKLTYFSNVIF